MSNETMDQQANQNGANGQAVFVQVPLLNSNNQSPFSQSNKLNPPHHTTLSVNQIELCSPNKINQIIKETKEAYLSGKTKDVKFRKEQLRKFRKLLVDNKKEICTALKEDLNKPPFETLMGEYNLVLNEITELEHELGDFAKPQHKSKTLLSFFDTLYVQHEPLGTVLIIGAWNYPLILAAQPFIGALAAGNCVILKMSECSPCTGKLLADLVPKYLDRKCYQVVNCDLQTTKYMLAEHKFDHIFYTGGENGGRAVYSAASKNLTPIVLELGGKSPVYIDDDVCDREALWHRIFWGKFLNAGQTCIAPDYVLCSEKAQQMARKYFHKTLNQFYNNDPTNGEHYTRIINFQHFDRLKRIIKESRMVVGGELNADKLSIEPAIVLDVSIDDAIMNEEIFGPILPFVTCSSAQKAIDIINSRPKPLALYLFTDSKKLTNKFLKNTTSGSVCVNDLILQIGSSSLPFGGVGGSGFGRYHGRYSLETFSNARSIQLRGFNSMLEWIGSARYPPYSDLKLTILTQMGAASVLAYQAISTLYPF